MEGIKFGTGGWRAIIGDDFIKSNIQKVTQGIADYIKAHKLEDKPVAVGHDRRFLSQEAMIWITEVLTGNGLSVLYVNRSVPTPLVMFTVREEKLHIGIAITASHNPSSYNGMKLIIEEGRDASLEVTNEVEALIAGVNVPMTMDFEEANKKGLAKEIKNPFNPFIDSILARLDTKAIVNRGFRILFDPMHGSGTYPLATILSTTRCTLDMINHNKDAYFGGALPAPTRDTLAHLALQVKDEKYDLGIAFDGDGDRLGIIADDGTYISANQILVMLYYYLHEYRGWKGPVVRNLATTHMLDRVAEAIGEKCYEVPVGFKYISSGMDEVDAVLGGESSGGLTVRGHIHGKDSVYAASLFVEMLCAIGKTVGEYWHELEERFGHYEMVECNLHFKPEEKADMQKKFVEGSPLPPFTKKLDHVSYRDGCKFYFKDDSFLICRFSGTEPLLRIFAESGTAEAAQKLVDEMKAFII